MNQGNEEVFSRWESEGGSSAPESYNPDGQELVSSMARLPTLPPGCQEQLVWGFRDGTGDMLYEFHHVYRPTQRLIDRAETEIDRLDQDLSYWTVTWSALSESGDEHPASRWMSYAQASKLPGPHLSFAEFSRMNGELFSFLQQRPREYEGLLTGRPQARSAPAG